MNSNLFSPFIYTHTTHHTHSARWPLSGWPPWFTESQHHFPSYECSQVLEKLPPDIQLRYHLPFWAWLRGSVILLPCLENASHQGTASDTYEKRSLPALRTGRALLLFSNSSCGLKAGLSASPRIITHTCKTFLGTLGQYFPTSHTKVCEVPISPVFHSTLSFKLLFCMTVADRVCWEHIPWREKPAPLKSPRCPSSGRLLNLCFDFLP